MSATCCSPTTARAREGDPKPVHSETVTATTATKSAADARDAKATHNGHGLPANVEMPRTNACAVSNPTCTAEARAVSVTTTTTEANVPPSSSTATLSKSLIRGEKEA